MTNEDWIEELYHLAADMGMFNEMHKKIDEIRKKHPKLNQTEVVELAFIEIKRIKKENNDTI